MEHELFAHHRACIEQNVKLVEEFIARHPSFSWRRPRAGTTALLETPWEDAEPHAHELAREAGVMVLPGACLGAGVSTVRLGLGRRRFGEALEVFERAIQSVKEKR